MSAQATSSAKGKKRRLPRIAAVDIGSNSIRTIVAEADGAGKFRILDDEKAAVRIGEGTAASGAISPAAWERAMDALRRMRKIVDSFGVDAVEAVATSAVRTAANGAEFIAAVRAETGIDIIAVTGEEEGELAALSAINNFDMHGSHYAIADLGGGSLEIVTAAGTNIEKIVSLGLGAVTLTEQFLRADPLRSRDHLALRRHIRKSLKNGLPELTPTLHCLIGSGGTFTSVASMISGQKKEHYPTVHGYEILHSEVVHLLAMLSRMNTRERRAVAGLSQERADIIVAGVTVIDELMQALGVNVLKINERGLREGIILRALRRHILLSPPRAKTWKSGVISFARGCHSDEEHARQVTRLALEVFDSLAERLRYGSEERRLLEAAGLLHDVGYLISYAGHHKHSYHLIRHADLFGFSPRERELVAVVARYHRRSLPKKKHSEFMRLSRADRQLVTVLGGLLRLADGLDRRRNAEVVALSCTASPTECRIRVRGDGDLSVEIFGARRKSDLLSQALGQEIVIEA